MTPAGIAFLLGPPVLVMATIFYLSSQTSTADHSAFEVMLRKVGHVTEYLVLSLCWIRAMRGLGVGGDLRGAVVAGIAATFAYAVTDEIHQTLVDGRHGTPVDVLIDSIGMMLTAALVLWAGPRRLSPATEPGPLPPERRIRERLDGVREPG